MVRVVCTTGEIVIPYVIDNVSTNMIQLVSKICTICTVDVTLVIVSVPNSTVSILG